MRIEDRESEEDFFNSDVPDKKPKAPKAPVYSPEDPDYWDQDESAWEHITPGKRRRLNIWLGVASVIIGLIAAVYLHWFSPAQEGAVVYGYVEQISKDGIIFKTFEGRLLPYREIMDTTRVYREDFLFSTADEKIAADLKRIERKGLPVRMEYNRYRATLPWRGANRVVVTAVDSVNPRRILPPEFCPEYIPGEKRDSLRQ